MTTIPLGERYARVRDNTLCCVQCGLPSPERTCGACGIKATASRAIDGNEGGTGGTWKAPDPIGGDLLGPYGSAPVQPSPYGAAVFAVEAENARLRLVNEQLQRDAAATLKTGNELAKLNQQLVDKLNAATWSDGREVECLRRELAMRKADQAGRAVHHAGQLAEVAVERDWYRNELLRVNPRLVAAHEKNVEAAK